MSTAEIGRLFGVNKSTISENLNRMGYKLRAVGKDRINNIHTVNIDFFNIIDTEEKAYILGFILADGHISKNSSLMFTLKNDDLDVLEKINNSMQSNYPITSCREKYNSLTITSKCLCDKLLALGFNHRKTYGFDFDKLVSNIPKCFYHHFIRGMFDGDGCIGYYKYDYFKKHSFHFGYTGLEEVVQFVKDFFGIKTKNIKETNLIYTGTTKDINKIIHIKNVMYNNANIFMNRKYNIFCEIEDIYNKEFK